MSFVNPKKYIKILLDALALSAGTRVDSFMFGLPRRPQENFLQSRATVVHVRVNHWIRSRIASRFIDFPPATVPTLKGIHWDPLSMVGPAGCVHPAGPCKMRLAEARRNNRCWRALTFPPGASDRPPAVARPNPRIGVIHSFLSQIRG